MGERTWRDEVRQHPFEPPIDHYFPSPRYSTVAVSVAFAVVIIAAALGSTAAAIIAASLGLFAAWALRGY